MQQTAVLADPAPVAGAAPAIAAAPGLLEIRGLGKRFGSLVALDDVSLTVRPGEVHCLLGENGAGKSTLCNLVFGVHAPDTGSMSLGGTPHLPANPGLAIAAGVAMVHQHFSLVQDLTVVENLLLGQSRGRLDRAAATRQIAEVSAEYGLEVDAGRVIADLSVGERQRVEIVKCLIRRPRLVLLDEPTAVLPPGEVNALLAVIERMAASGCGVILVTHKLAEIARVATWCTVMRGGRVVESTAMAGTDIKSLVRAMVGRDVASLSAASAAGLGFDESDDSDVSLQPGQPAPAQAALADALQIDDLTVVDANGSVRLDNVTLNIKPGEILGIAGVEGNGQSELGLVLAGLLQPTAGRVFVGKRDITGAAPRAITAAGVGIVPEDRHATGCITAMSVTENMLLAELPRYSRFGLVRRGAMTERARELMKTFDVRAADPWLPFTSLSGGNQQKAVLARELTLDKLVFLLAAQPTRGLDVGAVEAVYGHIRSACERGVGVLLISSELDELLAVASRVAVIYRGRIVGTMDAKASNRDAIGALMSGHAA